ncbi:MAG: glycosyltransferase [Sphingomonadales bacterium]|nr:glycosyltransferase [Sphingomonadales bacterium]
MREPLRGKGNAVRRAFAAIDADIYAIADGDGTYDAARAPELIDALIDGRLDMVIGTRRKADLVAYRRGHEIGNLILRMPTLEIDAAGNGVGGAAATRGTGRAVSVRS